MTTIGHEGRNQRLQPLSLEEPWAAMIPMW